VSARIALIGFMLESNAFSPVADEAEFREKHWLDGEAILDDARSATPVAFSSVLKVELLVCNAEGRSRPRGPEPARIHQPSFRFVPKFAPKWQRRISVALRSLTKSLILLVGVQGFEPWTR
jgi:hypothetical protein